MWGVDVSDFNKSGEKEHTSWATCENKSIMCLQIGEEATDEEKIRRPSPQTWPSQGIHDLDYYMDVAQLDLPSYSNTESDINLDECVEALGLDCVCDDYRLFDGVSGTKAGMHRDHFQSDKISNEIAHGAAVWDIFRRQDVPKLVEYLDKYQKEFRHYNNSPVDSVVHPIHDQKFYLNEQHKKQLKEFGIEAWTFEQHLGDAVFIPAGCPHQVRNRQSCTKVAVDFVSPDNIQECLRLTQEFRLLPPSHRSKQDILEVKKLAVHAASATTVEVKNLMSKIKEKGVNYFTCG